MANTIFYVVFGLLVVVITMMIWNRRVDNYAAVSRCQIDCQNIDDVTQRQLCVQKCLGHKVLSYGGQRCASDDDCNSNQVCVLGGAYSGGEMNGYCMDQNSPGTVIWEDSGMSSDIDSKENFRFSASCLPNQFWNVHAQRCEPLLQGVSSPYAINNRQPVSRPEISIPGSLLPGFGTSSFDPRDKLTNLTIY